MAQSAADRNESGGNRINGGPAGIDLNKIDQEDANRLMSEEHRRYGCHTFLLVLTLKLSIGSAIARRLTRSPPRRRQPLALVRNEYQRK